MDHWTRETIERAIAADDAAAADFARQVQKQQDRGLVYKTYTTPKQVADKGADMDTESAERWNAWARAHVDLARAEFGQAIEALASEVGSHVGRLEKRVKQLESEIAELREQKQQTKTNVTRMARHVVA